MTRLRILRGMSDRVLTEIERDIDPDDGLRCLVALRDEHRAQRFLGDWRDYRVQAWDPRRGWVTHTIESINRR